jgi:2,3-diketo-5-methylthio-1-phosphopentane phosphatase
MIRFAGRGLLLDLEGTLTSPRFMQEELLGYARAHLFAFLRTQWNAPEAREVREQIAREAGADSFLTFGGGANTPPEYMFRKLREHVTHLMNTGAASPGLQQLQGMIWWDGFHKGELRSFVYDEVPLALEAWTGAGREVRVLACLSTPTQQAFFKQTKVGDLSKLLSGFHDTTPTAKQDAATYRILTAEWGLAPQEILFLSGSVAAADAAHQAGLKTALVFRPQHRPVEQPHGHTVIKSLAEVELA